MKIMGSFFLKVDELMSKKKNEPVPGLEFFSPAVLAFLHFLSAHKKLYIQNPVVQTKQSDNERCRSKNPL